MTPYSGDLVVFGVAGENYLNPSAGVQAALEDAARKVAFFYAVQGTIAYSENKGDGLLDYASETSASLQKVDYKQYLSELKHDPATDVYAIPSRHMVFVRARYTAPKPLAVKYNFSGAGEKPAWVETTPEIPGFYVGVGRASWRMSYNETVIKSYENAIYSIINTISIDVRAGRTLGGNTASLFSFQSSSATNTIATGTLSGFCVLEVWIEPGEYGAVWTLAVANP
jgi:hypothetical protein